MEMLTVETELNAESSSVTSISEASYDELINMLFDRAFGPYEVKVGGQEA